MLTDKQKINKKMLKPNGRPQYVPMLNFIEKLKQFN